MGFKGGHVEKDLLLSLNIPYIDLEQWGCPKFDKLPRPLGLGCGCHANAETHHCPQLECEAFWTWTRAMQTRMDALPNLQPHHTVHFTMQSDHFSHAFQSTTFTVDEFRRDSARLRTYLQSLADKLNSNEEFEVDDSFSVEMTFISNPGRGGRGKRHRGRRLGRTAIETLLKRKQTVVRVLNTVTGVGGVNVHFAFNKSIKPLINATFNP